MPNPNTPPLMPGQFSGPPTNSERVSDLPSKSKEEVPNLAQSVPENPDAALQTQPSRPKTKKEKEEEYLRGLEEVGIDRVQARVIMEAVAVKRVYEEEHTVGFGGKITIRIRTRGYRDVQRAMRYLEVESPTYNMAIQDLVARYNMAASLIQYNEMVFDHPQKFEGAKDEEIEDAFDKRLAFVMDLPTVIIDRMMQILHDFDLKVAAVFKDGAPEDF